MQHATRAIFYFDTIYFHNRRFDCVKRLHLALPPPPPSKEEKSDILFFFFLSLVWLFLKIEKNDTNNLKNY